MVIISFYVSKGTAKIEISLHNLNFKNLTMFMRWYIFVDLFKLPLLLVITV